MPRRVALGADLPFWVVSFDCFICSAFRWGGAESHKKLPTCTLYQGRMSSRPGEHAYARGARRADGGGASRSRQPGDGGLRGDDSVRTTELLSQSSFLTNCFCLSQAGVLSVMRAASQQGGGGEWLLTFGLCFVEFDSSHASSFPHAQVITSYVQGSRGKDAAHFSCIRRCVFIFPSWPLL